MKRSILIKGLLIFFGFGVGACIVWAATTAKGSTDSVTPCGTTVGGMVQIANSGSVWVTGSGEPELYQFAIATCSMYGCSYDCFINDTTTFLGPGESREYTQYAGYDSTLRPNGTHTSWGKNSARPVTYPPGSYTKLSEKSCNYTVDN